MRKTVYFFTFSLLLMGLSRSGYELHAGAQEAFIGLPAHKIVFCKVRSTDLQTPVPPSYQPPKMEISPTPFWMSTSEVRVKSFIPFLQKHPELIPHYTHLVDSTYRNTLRPKPGKANTPITNISLHDAASYCRWISEHSGLTCRLPSPNEWRSMARCDNQATPYPWGWESPEGRAVWNCDQPRAVGFFSQAPQGFVDVIGNVYEWSKSTLSDRGTIHGGAWSDKRPEALTIQQDFEQDPKHRSTDIGFRILLESPWRASNPEE